MPIDWDAVVLGPLERVFGEADKAGGPIMYYPYGGEPYPIDGVFDEAWRDLNMGDPMVAANTTYPVLGVRLAAFRRQPQQDDELYIPRAGKRYLVVEVMPDSHGSAMLKLGAMS